MSALDSRIHAFREDCADIALQSVIKSPRFLDGRPARIALQRPETAPCSARPFLYRTPDQDPPEITSELLPGEAVRCFENQSQGTNRSWVQAERDRYVGYIDSAWLNPGDTDKTGSYASVCVAQTLIYDSPSLKAVASGALPMNAAAEIDDASIDETHGFIRLKREQGWLYQTHLDRFAQAKDKDSVSFALDFLGAPYLWGGRTCYGIDCSGLVQMALWAKSVPAPRDSDLLESFASGKGSTAHLFPPVRRNQQERQNAPLAISDMRRGDLVFWPGHVALAVDNENILHANRFHMQVAVESLSDARDRIMRAGLGEISGIYRLAGL